MFFSLASMSQYLLATTVATVLTTLGVLPRVVRESHLQSVILVLIVLSTGQISAWLFHDLWLILALTLFPCFVGLIWGRSWAPWAAIYGACLIQNVCVLLLYCAWMALRSPDPLASVIGVIVLFVQVVAVLVTLAATFDVLNVLGRHDFPHRDHMLLTPDPLRWPSICVQVPAYNEPPELLAQTIQQLMQQDYPGNWLVQVVDNNTSDPQVWLPIRDLCQQLGERVQFIHLDNWPGFKSGALNEATRRLPAWVEVVAVVDADYLVEPNFLRATTRHFADPEVAFVQTPQHYREWQGVPYFEGLNYMYEYFFAISMVCRRELRSIVCFGSMCLIRRTALEQIGGWDEGSITEDVELSVRLLGRGWRGVYDHRCYGAGLMPFDFGSLKRQRFRWAFGMIHVWKKHWRLMLGLPVKGYSLTFQQRWCFWCLGLQYLAEVPPFLFALLLVVSLLASCLGYHVSPPALIAALVGPLLLLVIASVRTVWALRETTRCTYSQAVGALIFSLSLSWTTARACISACIHRKGVFLRTPKMHNRQKWQQALRITIQEMWLSLCFMCVAVFATRYHLAEQSPSPALLWLQACVYSLSVICALAAEGIWLLPRSLFGTYQKRYRMEFMKKTESHARLDESQIAQCVEYEWLDPVVFRAIASRGTTRKLISPVAQRRYTHRVRKLGL